MTCLTAGWALQASSTVNARYLHQGGRWWATTGLYDFRNRHLSPTLGRWLQVDPLGLAAGDPNLYRYVGNSPVNARDLLGTWLITENATAARASALSQENLIIA